MILKYYSTKKIWNSARDYCKSKLYGLNGDLVVDTTTFTHTFIDGQSSQLWIGGRKSGNTWKWVDGTTMDMRHASQGGRWAAGEPQSSGLYVVGNYLYNNWDNQYGSNSRPFVCQYKPSTSNEEDIIDGRLIRRYQTNRTFYGAKADCEAAGGHLLVADTEDIIYYLKHVNGETWIGATDEKTEGKWVWTDGKQLSENSTYWAEEFPKYAHCALNTIEGFNNRDCMELHPYACQFKTC